MNINKFFIYAFLTTLFLSVYLIGSENHSFIGLALERLEASKDHATNPIEQARLLNHLENALTTHLAADCDSYVYYSELRNETKKIDNILSVSNSVYDYLHPIKKTRRILSVIDGEETWIYYNHHSDRYLEEVENYENNKTILKIETLNKDTIRNLKPGIHYSFVVTLDKKMLVVPEFLYKVYDENEKKALVGPSHAILSSDQPILAGGVLYLYVNNDKLMVFLNTSTGHYKTQIECLQHAKKLLVSFGVPEEAIFCSSVKLKETIFKVSSKFIKEIMGEFVYD